MDKAVAANAATIDLIAHVRGDDVPIARIRLAERVDVDQEALRFDPFRTGRGLVPRGFLQYARRATYAASEWARPDSEWLRQKGRVV